LCLAAVRALGLDSIKEIEDQVKVIKDDIRWFNPDVLKGIDAVFDLAALSNDPSGELDPQKTMEINYMGRVRVAKLTKKKGVKKYVLASTCSVYGFQLHGRKRSLAPSRQKLHSYCPQAGNRLRIQLPNEIRLGSKRNGQGII